MLHNLHWKMCPQHVCIAMINHAVDRSSHQVYYQIHYSEISSCDVQSESMKAYIIATVCGLLATCQGHRDLLQCSSSAVSSANSFAKNAISQAVSDAFAQCTSCPCENQAQSASESVAIAVARALADTQLSVIGTPGCQGTASGSASAKSVAQASATAFANALADACGTKALSQNKAVQKALAEAAASVSAEIAGNGGNAAAAAQAVSEDITPAIAKATSQALARCACTGENPNQAGAGTSAEASTNNPGGALPNVGGTGGASNTVVPPQKPDFGDILDFSDAPFPSFSSSGASGSSFW